MSRWEDLFQNHQVHKIIKEKSVDNSSKMINSKKEEFVGDIIVAGYSKNADYEKDVANFWRWAAIMFIILTTIWTGVSYFLGSSSGNDAATSISWSQIIKAFSITGVLLFGAAYSAKQSDVHRQNEKQTRLFALQLQSLISLLSLLEEKERNSFIYDLKDLICQKYENNEKDKVFDDHAFKVVIKGITDVLKAK